MPDAHYEKLRHFVSPEIAVVESRTTGTHAGMPYDVHLVVILTLHDSKIAAKAQLSQSETIAAKRGLDMDPTNNTLHCTSADFPMRRTRYLRFVELWRTSDWVLKVYLHSAHSDELARGYLVGAKTLIEPQLSEAERTEPLHRVGFLILAHGAVNNWVVENPRRDLQAYLNS